MRKITKIYMVGVGGQGVVRAARILADAAIKEGLEVLMNEVHGMAQRGGIVETSIVIGPAAGAMIGEGDSDIFLAFEPLEAMRVIQYSSGKTLAIVNKHPINPPGVHKEDGRHTDFHKAFITLQQRCRKLVLLDGTAMAVKAGSVRAMNTVILGVLAESGALPFSPYRLLDAVLDEVPTRFIEANRSAFAMGREHYLEPFTKPAISGKV